MGHTGPTRATGGCAVLVEQILAAKGRDVETVAPDATVADAVQALAARNVGALVVQGDEAAVGAIDDPLDALSPVGVHEDALVDEDRLHRARLLVHAAHWATFGWVAVLGSLAGTVLGIAVAGLPGSAQSLTTGVTAFAVVLQFFSGVFFAFPELPGWMQQVAAVFPLKWLTQGMRSAFLPEQAAAFEVAGGWEHGRTALVLAGWVIIGVVVCTRTFRWRSVDR